MDIPGLKGVDVVESEDGRGIKLLHFARVQVDQVQCGPLLRLPVKHDVVSPSKDCRLQNHSIILYMHPIQR